MEPSQPDVQPSKRARYVAFTVGLISLMIAAALFIASSNSDGSAELHGAPKRRALARIIASLLARIGKPPRVMLLAELPDEAQVLAAADHETWRRDAVSLAISEVVNDLPKRSLIGIHAFGQRAGRCTRSERLRSVAPIGAGGSAEVVAPLTSFRPSGEGSFGVNLRFAADDLGEEGGHLIVVMDGQSRCVSDEELCTALGTVGDQHKRVRIAVVWTGGAALRLPGCLSDGGNTIRFFDATPGMLAAALLLAIPMRLGVAGLLILGGAITFFALCDLLTEVLGRRYGVWGRAGFISDIVFAVTTSLWATLWLSHAARLPLLVGFVIGIAGIVVLYRKLPRYLSSPVDARVSTSTPPEGMFLDGDLRDRGLR